MTKEVKGQKSKLKREPQRSAAEDETGENGQPYNSQFAEMSEDDFNELMRLIRMYLKEAKKCQDAKSYLAGCVMVGGAMEGVLTAAVSMFPQEVKVSKRLPRDGKQQIKSVLDWSLSQLLIVAEDIAWLPRKLSWEDIFQDKNAEIGDYAERVRVIRNLAHPARYIKDHSSRRVTKIYLEHLFEIFDAVTAVILDKVYADLRREMTINGDAPGRVRNTLRPTRRRKQR